MKRRWFLGAAAGAAAALVVPERQKLYFFGGWPAAQDELICFPCPGHGRTQAGGIVPEFWSADVMRALSAANAIEQRVRALLATEYRTLVGGGTVIQIPRYANLTTGAPV